MLLLCYIYSYNLLGCQLLVDLIKEAVDQFTELDIEMIYVMMKIIGFKLRGDSPSDLKDIILSIKAKAETEEWK